MHTPGSKPGNHSTYKFCFLAHTYTHIYIYIHTHTLEKKIAAHSSILAWRIPWTEVPGGLWSMGLQKSQT